MNHDLVFQLLFNLINNAIRYTKTGGTIHVVDQYVPADHYTLFRYDTEIGIRQEDLATTFNLFKKSGYFGG